MNKVILIGRLTKDAELRYTQSNNTAVASFCIAVDRKYTKSGEERGTDFINIVAWNSLAEVVSKNLKKGMRTAVSGRLETRNWEDDEGRKHYATEVIAEDIDFIDYKKKEGSDESILYRKPDKEETSENKQDLQEFELEGDDELPF